MGNKLPWPVTYMSSPIHPERKVAMFPIKDAENFRELCRIVVKRENFTEYAEKLWKEIFEAQENDR